MPACSARQVAGRDHLLEDRAGPDEPGAMRLRAEVGRLGEAVDAPDDAVVDAVGLLGLRVVLVVEGDVVEDVLAVVVHPLDAVADDRRQLVGERRVVGPDVRDGRGEDVESGRRRAGGPRR